MAMQPAADRFREWLCNRLQTGSEEFDSLSLLFLHYFSGISDYFYKCQYKAILYHYCIYKLNNPHA